jgi:hypothetical protein
VKSGDRREKWNAFRNVTFIPNSAGYLPLRLRDHLWDVLDDPQLNKALGLPQNSRMTFRGSRF